MHVLDELADLQRPPEFAQGDGVACESGLWVLLVKDFFSGEYVLTSSSIRDTRARRYSSIVRWNASRSLRLTGTIPMFSRATTHPQYTLNSPPINPPTSSIVSNCPLAGLPKPPR